MTSILMLQKIKKLLHSCHSIFIKDSIIHSPISSTIIRSLTSLMLATKWKDTPSVFHLSILPRQQLACTIGTPKVNSKGTTLSKKLILLNCPNFCRKQSTCGLSRPRSRSHQARESSNLIAQNKHLSKVLH